jgi:hypothetical protein
MFFRRALPKAFGDYPPAGSPWADADPDKALARVLAMKQSRLAHLTGLLAAAGIDLAAGLAYASPRPLCQALDAWVARDWPALARSLPPGFSEPRQARWSDQQRVPFSVALDTGLALGELLLRHRPGLAWGVYRFDDHIADDEAGANDVVVLDPALPPDARDPLVFDAFGTAYWCLLDFAYKLRSGWTFSDAIARQLHEGPGWPDIDAL